jgi:hypothetical protein
MFIDRRPATLSALTLFLCLVLCSPAVADQRHCPSSSVRNSHVVCGNGCDQSADKARVEFLATHIIRVKAPVCLVAMVDPERGYSKKLAIRRVLWVRDALVERGVLSDSIAVELRPLIPGSDKTSLQQVEIIFDQ